jgi:hypothetical protein
MPVAEPQVFHGKLKRATCRDGSKCSSDKDCAKRGLNSKCKERDGNGVEKGLKKTTCRDGSKCSSDKDCANRGLNSICKKRNGDGVETQIIFV